jgi:GNAT-family acetyltransferase (TIGR03103 family)
MTAEAGHDTARATPLSVPGTEPPPAHLAAALEPEVVVDCGWGKLIFGQTFRDPAPIAAALRSEELGQRDIAMYVRDPHVVVAQAPQELFVDPSYTYRLWLDGYEPAESAARVHVRKMASQADGDEMNRVFTENGMVTAPPAVMWERQRSGALIYLVAVDLDDGRIVGTVMGVDHRDAFSDPERGSSLWTLCVSPHCGVSGVGETLARALAEELAGRGCAYLDLSVMYDNEGAIALYDKLGFTRVPVFAVKRKNPINEPLFAHTPGTDYETLNPYGRIIADEARRRGILVEILDAEFAFLRLTHGGRVITMRESLSELTTAVAMTRCDDKRITRRTVARADIRVPAGRMASFDERDRAFLEEKRELVVKPVRGEQGRGVSVGVTTPDELDRALERAAAHCPEVLLEECVRGEDLRLVVIDHRVVAASIRRPARVVGTGRHTVLELIEKQSRRRERATGGESRIPVTDATRELLAKSGHALEDVLPAGVELVVSRKANLHAGGTIHDVTERLHPALAEAATRATRALEIPVCGVDFIVEDVERPEYVMIEANERPGLANHEPQPTAQRFIDLLFPESQALPEGWGPNRR